MNFLIKLSLIALVLVFGSLHGSCQATDTCAIAPTQTATIDGITAKGMLTTADLEKFKKMVPAEAGLRITGFNYSIDCDNCELINRHVDSDTFTADDMKLIATMTSRQIISFACIAGTNKKGELITYKPFLFYIR